MKKTKTQPTHWVEQRSALLKEREVQSAIIDRINQTGLDGTLTEASGELSSIDQHAADQGSEMYEREKDIGLKERAVSVLEMVDHALERIDAGTYATCEACGQDIGRERLEAIPFTSRCIECEQQFQSALDDARPASERTDQLTMGHTKSREDVDMGYDGDDVWEELSHYGTANSPQDVLPTNDDADDDDNV